MGVPPLIATHKTSYLGESSRLREILCTMTLALALVRPALSAVLNPFKLISPECGQSSGGFCSNPLQSHFGCSMLHLCPKLPSHAAFTIYADQVHVARSCPKKVLLCVDDGHLTDVIVLR